MVSFASSALRSMMLGTLLSISFPIGCRLQKTRGARQIISPIAKRPRRHQDIGLFDAEPERQYCLHDSIGPSRNNHRDLLGPLSSAQRSTVATTAFASASRVMANGPTRPSAEK